VERCFKGILYQLKISIITPSFNSGKYIERAIQSVLIQDYDNWEHIIVDGGSTDNTIDILQKYDHLQWVSESDSGQSDAMNKGFKMSKGDIIVYLNADDEFISGVFEKVVSVLKSREVDMVVGDLYKIFPEQKPVTDVPNIDLVKILNYWPCTFPLNSLSYFYKRELQLKVGLFPTDNNFSMDYWFLLRALKSAECFRINEPFGHFYYFDNKSSDESRARQALKKVRNEFLYENPNLIVKYLFHRLFQ
jgi:glycosyltransferase involved in cell wall biosynthesis